MDIGKEDIFTVSEITTRIKAALESSFGKIKLKGELSNVRAASSGHLYFTIKDENAVISGVMFKGRIPYLRFKPSDGLLVVATGNISVYAKRGTYQILCERIELAGEGNILAMLEERKRKLAAEGLFDSERKKPPPPFPSKIGVVTSPTGAAIRDILQVLRRRNAGLNLVILPAPVQGGGAGDKIAAQIKRANMFKLADVLIIGRGGGSLEDLLPFSEEAVVRAVSESEIPVISAVGHEIDTSLSDLAADLRAPTPSAAAELVTERQEDLRERIGGCLRIIEQEMETRLERTKLLLRQFTPEQMERNFMYILQPNLLRLDDCKEGILRGMENIIRDQKHNLNLLSQSLESSAPEKILSKGYAIVRDGNTGDIIKNGGETEPGNSVHISFLSSGIEAEVKKTTDQGYKGAGKG